MKDGCTHLAYKAEHAVDLASEAILATTVTFADQSDPQSAPATLSLAEANLGLAGREREIEEAVMDKGYHDNRLLARLARQGVRSYLPERRQKSRCWTDKPAAYEHAFRANRRRVRGNKGQQLNRWRRERCERTIAHVRETGGGRRAWVRGQTNVSKVLTLKCAAYNLGLLLRKGWGLSKPRNAEAGAAGVILAVLALWIQATLTAGRTTSPIMTGWLAGCGGLVIATAAYHGTRFIRHFLKKRHSVTGCYAPDPLRKGAVCPRAAFTGENTHRTRGQPPDLKPSREKDQDPSHRVGSTRQKNPACPLR